MDGARRAQDVWACRPSFASALRREAHPPVLLVSFTSSLQTHDPLMAIIEAPRLYAVVTGANSGVGLGISTRFLLQSTLALLDNPYHPPPDSLPQKEPFRISPLLAKSHGCPFFPCEGITLILACRSQARAMAARQTLLDSLRAELARKVLKRSDRDRLMDSVEIVWEGLDLSEMGNVHDFVTRVQKKWDISGFVATCLPSLTPSFSARSSQLPVHHAPLQQRWRGSVGRDRLASSAIRGGDEPDPGRDGSSVQEAGRRLEVGEGRPRLGLAVQHVFPLVHCTYLFFVCGSLESGKEN